MVTWAGFQVQDYGNLACLFPGVSARSQADSLLDDGAWRRRWDSEKPVWLGQEKRTVRGSLPTTPTSSTPPAALPLARQGMSTTFSISAVMCLSGSLTN